MKSMYRMCWGFVVGFVGMLVLLYFAGVFVSWEWDISTWWEFYRAFMIMFAITSGVFCAAMADMSRN